MLDFRSEEEKRSDIIFNPARYVPGAKPSEEILDYFEQSSANGFVRSAHQYINDLGHIALNVIDFIPEHPILIKEQEMNKGVIKEASYLPTRSKPVSASMRRRRFDYPYATGSLFENHYDIDDLRYSSSLSYYYEISLHPNQSKYLKLISLGHELGHVFLSEMAERGKPVPVILESSMFSSDGAESFCDYFGDYFVAKL